MFPASTIGEYKGLVTEFAEGPYVLERSDGNYIDAKFVTGPHSAGMYMNECLGPSLTLPDSHDECLSGFVRTINHADPASRSNCTWHDTGSRVWVKNDCVRGGTELLIQYYEGSLDFDSRLTLEIVYVSG